MLLYSKLLEILVSSEGSMYLIVNKVAFGNYNFI